MYEAHYGFNEKPFNLTPDPKFLYLSARHTEAFAHMEFGHRERGGFVVITGEVGTGKTTLARYFLSQLSARTGDQTDTAVILYPALSAAELLRTILQDLSIPPRGDSFKDNVDTLHEYLLTARREGRNVVLLIDEAQGLSPEVLEQVRLISNLETDTEKLIQIVLMGQSELHELLERHELRQLAQRVTARYHLGPLSRSETAGYVAHRIAVAGGEGKVQFSPKALSAVHRWSRGVPRLLNLICDRSLLAGYVKGTRVIEPEFVDQAAREVLDSRPQHKRWPRIAAGVTAGAIVVALTGLMLSARDDVEGPVHAPRQEKSPAETQPPSRAFEPVLLSLPGSASRDSALREVRGLWGDGPVEYTTLRTHLRHLRRLNLPVVLELFHPQRRDTCYVALLGLEENVALVSTGSGVAIHVPLEEVDRYWTRQATFVWRDFESLNGTTSTPRGQAWITDMLSGLGYPEAGELSAALARFQRETDLAADGLAGKRTLMTLYSLSASTYPQPRLTKEAS